MLTVGFTIATQEGYDFWNTLKEAATFCPNKQVNGWTYDQIYSNMILTVTVIIYASVCQLILATVYFLFRAPPHQRREKWSIYKERFLVFAVFIVTFFSVCAALIHFTYLLNYFLIPMEVDSAGIASMEKSVCSYSTRGYWMPGVGACAISVFAGVYLMW